MKYVLGILVTMLLSGQILLYSFTKDQNDIQSH
jgi:hypothetical protein